MTIPEDVFQNTSSGLSSLIAKVLDDEALDQPATLAGVRAAVLSDTGPAGLPLNRFFADASEGDDASQALRDEIDALIEEYGGGALAVRFMRPRVSDELSRLISAGLDALDTPRLVDIFAAAESGLLARLIGQGEIDDDAAQTVIAELADLIERHGEDALAEDFLEET